MTRSELERVRASAGTWRSGLAGLLAALAGFSLIKGRADFTVIVRPWPIVVGVLLASAMVVGGLSAYCLLRAEGGEPSITASRLLEPQEVSDHIEAIRAARALRWGIRGTFLCALLLISTLAVSWYAPSKSNYLQVRTELGVICGTVSFVGNGVAVLNTAGGQRLQNLTEARSLQIVNSC
jgi:hypothetical protein